MTELTEHEVKWETQVLLVSEALGSDLGPGSMCWLKVFLDPSRLMQGG
jgi:hypothetical protein